MTIELNTRKIFKSRKKFKGTFLKTYHVKFAEMKSQKQSDKITHN